MVQFLANGLCLGAIFAVVALGFGFIYTTTRVFHIALAGIIVLTGYTLSMTTVWWKLPLALGIALSLVTAALSGMFIDWAVYQPLTRRSASVSVILMSSIGVQIVLENFLILIFGTQTQFLRPGIERTLIVGSVTLTYIQILQLTVGVILTTAFWLFLKYTRTGQVCRAVSDDETLALVLGVQVTRVRLLTFALGSILAGTGSILVSLDVGLDPHMGFPLVLTAAVACIIGGLRNFFAPVIGGFILGILQSLVIWQTSAKWEEAVTFGVLIIFLLIRRQGLFGTYQRAEEA